MTNEQQAARQGMFERLVEQFRAQCAHLPDFRKPSPNLTYSVADAALSAFAVFFTQAPSFLAHQRDMQRRRGRNNAQSLFGVHQIPSDNQIRKILDPIAPSHLGELFWQVYAQCQAARLLDTQTGVAGNLLVALDGVQYFSSSALHCPQCTHSQHGEQTRYSHSLIAPVLVAPDSPWVFNLEPEFIQPQDGSDKQDCEQNAIKRWLQRNAPHLPAGRTTMLADDLHGHQPLCELLRAYQFNFILVCLPSSHETLYREIDLLAQHGLLQTLSERVWNGRFYEQCEYRFTTHAPLRAGAEALMVDWCEVKVWHTRTGELLYHNAFITNFHLTAESVAAVVRSGRARWKTENENHNVLKQHGYHLEHNFGHGQRYLAALLVTLNLLAFLFHTLLWLTEPLVHTIQTNLGTLTTFWDDVRTLTRYLYFPSWSHLFHFMAVQLELAASP